MFEELVPLVDEANCEYVSALQSDLDWEVADGCMLVASWLATFPKTVSFDTIIDNAKILVNTILDRGEGRFEYANQIAEGVNLSELAANFEVVSSGSSEQLKARQALRKNTVVGHCDGIFVGRSQRLTKERFFGGGNVVTDARALPAHNNGLRYVLQPSTLMAHLIAPVVQTTFNCLEKKWPNAQFSIAHFEFKLTKNVEAGALIIGDWGYAVDANVYSKQAITTAFLLNFASYLYEDEVPVHSDNHWTPSKFTGVHKFLEKYTSETTVVMRVRPSSAIIEACVNDTTIYDSLIHAHDKSSVYLLRNNVIETDRHIATGKGSQPSYHCIYEIEPSHHGPSVLAIKDAGSENLTQ